MNLDYSSITQEWAKQGFSCGIWTDSPGLVWANYVHDSDELVMLIEGEIELQFQGKTIHPLLGEEILIPAHQPHTVINPGRTINRWYYPTFRTPKYPNSFSENDNQSRRA